MTHHRWHFLEKLQVEIAAAVGLVLMYYVAWPMIRPWDVDGAATFVPQMAFGRLALFALSAWAAAALCALLTVSARPEGGLLAALVAVGGTSLHSGSIRQLLMRHQHNLGELYVPLIWELLLMAVVLVGIGAVVLLVRGGIRRINPAWVRPDAGVQPTSAPATKGRKPAPEEKKDTRADWLVSIIASCLVTVAVAYVLMLITLFSAERGQILFAVAISFFVGSALAHYLFPTPNAGSNCFAVLVLAVVFFLKACLVPGGDLAWVNVAPFAQALPVDWLAAGCGGATGGYWLSSRLHDVKHLGKPRVSESEE